MRKDVACCWLVPAMMFGLAAHGVRAASTSDEAVAAIANHLVLTQHLNGSWPGAEGYTGVIVAGLANAYMMTETPSYMLAATGAGEYILDSATETGFYGDEAYGLTRLSELSPDPANNKWRSSVASFYARVATEPGVGTTGYIAALKAGYAEDSVPVFYLANHTLAAYYVNAADKALWRQALIDTLARVNDNDAYPVLSLGTAVWALAQTGSGLDNTVIPVTAMPGRGTYAGYTLRQLPAVLANHQVMAGYQYGGSYFYLFSHTADSGPVAGYTEDTIFGTLGLAAATLTGWRYEAKIMAAEGAIAGSVEADGLVYDHLWLNSFFHDAFAGEALMVLTLSLPCGAPRVDADRDGDVDQSDFGVLQACFTGSSETYVDPVCQCFDNDSDGNVDSDDLQAFSSCFSGPSVPADPTCGA